MFEKYCKINCINWQFVHVRKTLFWELFYREVAFKTPHFTWTVYLDCVPLISLISRTEIWQIHDIAGCSVYCRQKLYNKMADYLWSVNIPDITLINCVWRCSSLCTLLENLHWVWLYVARPSFFGGGGRLDPCLFSVRNSGCFIAKAHWILSYFFSVFYLHY
jgi:hypothetical protein